jgi:hypothetical protein
MIDLTNLPYDIASRAVLLRTLHQDFNLRDGPDSQLNCAHSIDVVTEVEHGHSK